MERLPVRYAALACVIAGGLLISGPGLLASADPGSGGTGSTTTTDNGSPSKGFMSALSTLPGLHWLSQLGGTAPTIGPILPPLMNLSTVPAPAAPTGPNLVQAFMLPNPGNPQSVIVTMPEPGSAPQIPGGQQPPAVVGSQPVDLAIAPQSQGQRQGANTLSNLPTITVVPLSPSGVPAGPTVTIPNPLAGATPFDPHKPILPQVLPTPLVLLLTAIAKDVPLTGLVITPLMNVTLPPLLADLLTGTLSSADFMATTLSPDTVLPAITPSVLSQAAAALMSASQPPPDVAPMGMDVPEAPARNPPVIEPLLTSPNNGVSELNEPVAFRAGYSDYLRNAGMAQITAIAVPGAVAILLFSAGGGFIGYRQARAGHIIRAEGITRFLH